MYKPPINTNRVKYMRSKFENNDNSTTKLNNVIIRNNKTINSLLDKKQFNEDHRTIAKLKREYTSIDLQKTSQPLVTRQLSDPLNKCNIKRTPAFRLDKNPTSHKSNKSNLLESKIKIFDQRLNNCDSNNINDKNHIVKDTIRDVSIDDTLIKSPEEKLDDIIQEKENSEEIHYANIKYLYAEPIPKAYRHISTNKTNGNDVDVHKSSEKNKTNGDANDNIVIVENPKLIKAKAIELTDLELDTYNLTDTLRCALKKPLPSGPAPKKPPRTFLHSPKIDQSPENEDVQFDKTINHIKLDENFTNDLNTSLQKSLTKSIKKNKTRSDPMYMLNKLENALRNNKIRLKRQGKLENTSGDESDYDCKSSEKQKLLSNNTTNNQTGNLFNLNCLSCSSNTTYEKIKEPNSSFFIENDGDEPVYAIPFHSVKDFCESPDSGNSQDSDNIGTLKRNSLYYMVSN